MRTEEKMDTAYSLFVDALGRILGQNSSVYRDISKALRSDTKLDLYLAEDAFNALPRETKLDIHSLVKRIASDFSDNIPA